MAARRSGPGCGAAERQEIEEASAILRKARASTHTLLPLTVITRTNPA